MELHLVGGFLGSGKSTAIMQAARLLTEQGLRVGIITNEQGKHLVDSGLLHADNLPALEVTGGCFCCHLDDFARRLEEITVRFDPQVIFAESVGSCSDLVATVIKPLIEWQRTAAVPNSLSVFTDSRLLLRYLRGQELPFSENVIYIFEKQIEETGVLVINKIDLLTEEQTQQMQALAGARYPQKTLLTQNSLQRAQVEDWLVLVRSAAAALPNISLDLDYDRYAHGEGRFVWLEREFYLTLTVPDHLSIIKEFLIRLADAFFQVPGAVAHLKCLLNDAEHAVKFSLTGMDDPAVEWAAQIHQAADFSGPRVHLLVNVMLEGDLQVAESLLDDTIDRYLIQLGVEIESVSAFSRVPGFPVPTARIGNH